jgi:ethanolamine ammonia-lyase large subunit
MDMVLHESRKYGLARHLSLRISAATGRRAWLHVNDVAGFIGPEVFRNRDQLVRCCLEDLVMGKLHGLCIGLDVCSTLHMDVSLDDLDYCLEQVAPANPAYLMALPTKIDPMLGYLTTGFQDHLNLRSKFGFKTNEPMRKFFLELGVITESGSPGVNFGRPQSVYLAYRRRKGDRREEAAILTEAETRMKEIRERGLFLTEGYGDEPHKLRADIDSQIREIYERSRRSIWAEYDAEFLPSLKDTVVLQTQAESRREYILRPEKGELLTEASVARVREFAGGLEGEIDVQIVLSDGLNALAVMDDAQRVPFIEALAQKLSSQGLRLSPKIFAVERGRVRAGYKIGELMFAGADTPRAVLHIVGERPGSGHDCFSVYMTAARGDVWSMKGKVDHDRTRVVSGVSRTALEPLKGADDAARVFAAMWNKASS